MRVIKSNHHKLATETAAAVAWRSIWKGFGGGDFDRELMGNKNCCMLLFLFHVILVICGLGENGKAICFCAVCVLEQLAGSETLICIAFKST